MTSAIEINSPELEVGGYYRHYEYHLLLYSMLKTAQAQLEKLGDTRSPMFKFSGEYPLFGQCESFHVYHNIQEIATHWSIVFDEPISVVSDQTAFFVAEVCKPFAKVITSEEKIGWMYLGRELFFRPLICPLTEKKDL